MDLELNHDQAEELRSLLDTALGDMSHEIAATDNAQYREQLRQRRDLLTTIRRSLEE